MQKFYPDRTPVIRDTKLDASTLAAMGRLIRAMAEIENVLTLLIGTLCKVTEQHLTILLGQMPISRKLQTAETLAASVAPEIAAKIKSAFDANFQIAISARNVIAHGVLLGVDDEGYLAFETTQTQRGSDNVITEIHHLHPEHIRQLGEAAEANIPAFESIFGLSHIREKARRRPLLPHPKAQPKRR